MDSEQLKELQRRLKEIGYRFEYTRQPEGDSLLYSVEKAECLVEVWADGRLSCQFGMDMEELRTLLAGSSNEDIAEDELQRVARDQLRPLFQKYRRPLLSQGFEEGVDTSEQHYAVSFVKSLNLSDSSSVISDIQASIQVLG